MGFVSKYYTYKGKQDKNLIAVCPACHNKLHPEKIENNNKNKNKFKKEERW